ncbi:MAG TPA: cupin domain-containing protein [Rhizomicrobium sp.]|jgi:quercetin dioxygenase-like cupin family protein|nr:cupin domain-containing protein [Rhizomicrobium sp.]
MDARVQQKSETDAAADRPFMRDSGTGPMPNVLGVVHVHKAMGADRAGSLAFWEAVVPRGAGAPPHVHEHDEAFFVLKGEIQVDFDGESRRVGPGGFFYGGRRRQAYRNVGDLPARVLILCTPSSGLDQMLAELDAAAASGVSGFENLTAITARYGVIIEQPAT